MSHRTESRRWRPSTRVLLFVLLLSGVLLAYFKLRPLLSLTELAQYETAFREFQQRRPCLVLTLAFLVYVLVTGFSLPGATLLSLTYAWSFGFATGVVLVSFGSTTGAAIAFLLSRYLFRDAIQSRFGDRLQTFNRRLSEDGALYLFSLRLLPMVPFFVINLVMGLTSMRLRTFWWISQIGMLPGTIAFVYAGASFPTLVEIAEQDMRRILTPRILVALAILGLLPLAAKAIVRRLDPNRQGTDRKGSTL